MASARCSNDWPTWGWMRAGACFAQPTRVRRTDESESSSLLIGTTWHRNEYPTPTGVSYGSAQNEGEVPHERPSRGTPSLDTWAKNWPTASSSDWKGSSRPGQRSGQLSEASEQQWPTPTVQNAKNDGGPSQHRRNTKPLDAEAQAWPTPNAGDERAGPTHAGGNPTLKGASEQWAAPTVGGAFGAGSRNVEGSKAHAGVSLSDQVRTGDSTGRGGKLKKARTPGRPDLRTAPAGSDGSPQADPLPLFGDDSTPSSWRR